MLEDAEASVLITNRALKGQYSAINAKVICVEDQLEVAVGSDVDDLIVNTLPESPAYILYTSGSTGQPKGVVITRQGLMNYVNWACAQYTYPRDMSTPLHSSLSFDLTITSLWPPLVAGGRVVIISEENSINGLVGRDLSVEQYGLVKITPSHLRVLENSAEVRRGSGLAQRTGDRRRSADVGGLAVLALALPFYSPHQRIRPH